MLDFLIAMVAIFSALMGWIWVQQLARRFAERYPQFGPAREEGSGCGRSCMCAGGTCSKKDKPGTAGRSAESSALADASGRAGLTDLDNRIRIKKLQGENSI